MIDEPDWDAADPDLAEPSCEWAGNIYIWLGKFAGLDAAKAYFTESLPNPDPEGCMISPFMRDYSLRTSPHYFREAGHLQWDAIQPDLGAQLRKLRYGEVFHQAAEEIASEDHPSAEANVLVTLYEADQGVHCSFQPKQAGHETPLVFVGCFCIDGELVEVLDALP